MPCGTFLAFKGTSAACVAAGYAVFTGLLSVVVPDKKRIYKEVG